MSNISNLGLKEIFRKVGVCVDESDMFIVFGRNFEVFNRWKEMLDSRVREMKKAEQLVVQLVANIDDIGSIGGIDSNSIKSKLKLQKASSSVNKSLRTDDFLPFEEQINKEALVLITLYNWQRKLENDNGLSERDKAKVRTNIKSAMNLIGRHNYDVIDVIHDGNDIKRLKVINSQELITAIKKGKRIDEIDSPTQEQIDRVEEIDRRIGLENMAQIISEEYLREMLASTEAIGKMLVAQVSAKVVSKYQESHPDIDVMAEIDNPETKDELNKKIVSSQEYKLSMAETIKENCKHINMDMLLLITGFRYVEILQYSDGGLKFVQHDGESTEEKGEEEAISLIGSLIVKMLGEIKGNPEFAVKYDDGRMIDYSKEVLRNDLRRFSGTRFIKIEETAEEKVRILSNEVTLDTADQEVLATIDFSDADFDVLIHNSEDNTIYLIDNNIIEKGEIKQVLASLEGCSERLFFIMYKKGLLDYEDIIGLLDSGKVKGEAVAKLEDEELIGKLNEHTKCRIKTLVLQMTTEENSTPEDLEAFVKYVTLYKKFNLEGKSEEEIAESTFEFIGSFEDDISNEILKQLYQFGVISLEAAADWGVNLTEMLNNDSIKPIDLKDLYAKQVISIEEIKNIIMHGSLSYEEKLDLIYSTFDGESEKEVEAREELTGLLGIGEGYKSEERKTGKIRGTGEGTRGREFITEPHTRWKLISLLDKDYSKKCLPDGKAIIDGHRVFLLPNHDKVVIERMHEKRGGKKVSAYGSATYIMSTEEFFRNINDIVVDGAINRTFLREAAESEQATKIIHSRHWGNAIKRQFNISIENSRYTEEDIEEIDRAIESVESSRKER